MNVNFPNTDPSSLIFNYVTPSGNKGVNVNDRTSQTVWSSLDPPAGSKGETVDFSKSTRPANADKFVLQLPSSEVVYKKSELFTGGKLGNDTAFCSTYSERRIDLGGGSVLSVSHSDGYFVLNPEGQKFGKSGEDISNLSHAVEETFEHITRSAETAALDVEMSSEVTENGRTSAAYLKFALRNAVYRYSKAGNTKGSVLFKNGGSGFYGENAFKFRQYQGAQALLEMTERK